MCNEKESSLSWAHPLVREWFLAKWGAATEPQRQGWPAILTGNTTLIAAPTGSGKTFAAFLTCIDRLVRKALAGELQNQTEVLYISPLKALSNDIQKNLTEPLAEMMQLAHQRNLFMKEIRAAVRTGDTLMAERQAMLKKPPHILVTTPESLYLLLTAKKGRLMLANIQTVIIDEIHALANNKRGTHLALSLERLEAITECSPVRIGLSATQKPIEQIAGFLTGHGRAAPAIIDIGHVRPLDLAVEVPASELGPVASNEMWDEIYDKMAALVQQNRSTLIFVNTRRLAERVAHHLAERLGEAQVAAHHGSLSRKIRLTVEIKLKQGELKALVATASLELGIDIGTIDLVCQIGSPRAIAVALQRVGRAGHWHRGISKGRFFVTTRDELLESAALIRAIRLKALDQLRMPDQPLDILAQQIVATCATGEWQEDDLFALVKRAYPYRDLSRDTFNAVLTMLAEGIAGSRGRYGAYLFRDRVQGIVKGRRGSRLTAITNGGAIPDNGLFTVIAEPPGTMVGTLDEDFAVESNRGDIILLGTTSWQIRRIESAIGRVLVEDAHGAPPSVPFWRGEAPARTNELSEQVSELRQILHDKLPIATPAIVDVTQQPQAESVIHWLKENCALERAAAEQLIDYLLQGRAVLGAVPTQRTIIAERFFDEAGGMQLIIHAPLGARINKAWGLALRKRFCRSFNFELQAAATDDGLNISLAEQHSFPLSDVFHFLHPHSIKEVLIQAILQSPLFNVRWRWVATRALALMRFRGGKKIPPTIQRMLADDLLAAVFPDAAACQDNLGGRDITLPDHPLINEVMKEALTDAMDLEGLQRVIKEILAGTIQCLAIDTPVPSVFSHEILNANPYAFLDDAPLEERRARAVEMRRVLPEAVLQKVGKLDPASIAEVQQQAWPDVRDADELHDVLQTLIALPEQLQLKNEAASIHSWQTFFNQLVAHRRATIATVNQQCFWLVAEKVNTFQKIYPTAVLQHQLPVIEQAALEREEAIVSLLRGWLLHSGPTTSHALSATLQLPLAEIEHALLKLETTGFVLRGKFTATIDSPIEWCERRLLARIHRLTINQLRREIEPVTAAQFMYWLLKWQHLLPGTQLRGEQGLLAIIRQLEGFEIAANAWETHILAKRMVDYDRHMLDRLCLTGVIGWGRLSPHPVLLTENSDETRKKGISPTSVAPITFFVRETSCWQSIDPLSFNLDQLSLTAKSIYHYLQQKGASFFTDILRGIGKLQCEIEMGLWELVAAGLITADSFDNLRALIDRRRRTQSKYRQAMPFNGGRWSVLHAETAKLPQERLEAICWLLLHRYGVVFRDILTREKNMPPWRELLRTFRRLEDCGEIRGGRFVSGFIGEQFALPYAIDSLRALKRQLLSNDIVTVAAADPLNLIGIILPGDRISAISGQKINIQQGTILATHRV